MARYRDDDDRDDRDRDDDRPRRRRRDRDYDDPAPAKGSTGKVLLIVGLAVGLPLLLCGGVGAYLFFTIKQGVEGLTDAAESQNAGDNFLAALSRNDVNGAYTAYTTPNFRATMSREQFGKLLAANPILTRTHYANSTTMLPKPTGTSPNRTTTITYSVTASYVGSGDDPDDEDDPDPDAPPAKPGVKPGGKPPKTTKPSDPLAPPVTCTVTVAEQPDKTWKVDGFKVP